MAQASASTKKTAKVSSKLAAKNVAVTKSTKAESAPKIRTKTASNRPFAQGTGRRKAAVATVFLRKGKGQILVNGRDFQEYFTVLTARQEAQQSFNLVPATSGMLADVKVSGGGVIAQANAVRLSIARALLQFNEALKPELRKQGFLTVDSRVKERKKYGQKAARRKFQFTKR